LVNSLSTGDAKSSNNKVAVVQEENQLENLITKHLPSFARERRGSIKTMTS